MSYPPSTVCNHTVHLGAGAGDTPMSNKQDFIVHLHKNTQNWLNGECMEGYRYNKVVVVSAYDEDHAETEAEKFISDGTCDGYHVVSAVLVEDVRSAPLTID